MRDFLYMAGLFAAFLALAMDFPQKLAEDCRERPDPSFASFVELSPSLHAACLELARTPWQVRSGSRANPVIGSLDSGIPLLSDFLPPAAKVEFREIEIPAQSAGRVDMEEYSLLPATSGADIPAFATRPLAPAAENAGPAFPRPEMLSVEASRKIKEIMQ